MHPQIGEHNHGRPRVERGEFGWLVLTRVGGETHVWSWRPLHRWADAVAYANELAWQMAEWRIGEEVDEH